MNYNETLDKVMVLLKEKGGCVTVARSHIEIAMNLLDFL